MTRKETYISPTTLSRKIVVKKIILLCGFFSSLLYVTTDLIASWWYEGYNILNQNYSELLATGAPTRPLMLLISIAYNGLLAAFAIGVWNSANPKRTAHITSAMIVGYAIVGLVTALFLQMDIRGTQITTRGSWHGPMTAIMSLFILLSMGFGAFLSGKMFRFYSFATIIVLIVFGILTSLQAPDLEKGLSTPWMGFTERINIYATMLWFAVFSIVIIKKKRYLT